MGGRNHDADIGAQRTRQHGDSGRRHRANEDNVHAHGYESGLHCGLKHVIAEPRILADNGQVAMVTAGEMTPRRHGDTQRGLRRHRFDVCFSPNAVGAKELARHVACPSRSISAL
jgi:hypothetical protein